MSALDAPSDGARPRASVSERWRAAERAAWLEAGAILVATRASFLLVAYAGAWFFATGPHAPGLGDLDVWSRWDALHFFSIAEHGYTGPGAGPHATAFFPGYPILLRVTTSLGASPVVAGLLVSALASLVAFAYLHRLAEADAGPGAGRTAVCYLALWPTAVFLVAPYSEALFLAGAIPAFWLARRGRWTLAGVPAAVAVATRAAGVFLLFGLALEFLRQRERPPGALARAAVGLGIGALPLLAYSVYLWLATGSPLRFFTDQRLGWGRELTNPVASFLNTWRTWRGGYDANWIFAWRVEILAAAAGLALVAWALAKREWGYAGYMGAMLAALLTSSWYFSIPRMLLSFFPAAIFLAEWSLRRPARRDLLLLALGPLAALGVLVFTRGAWFY
jgi:hypothetical protein